MRPRPTLMVAPTGARRTKADHPNLPITPEEQAATARACYAAGADALHLHVRNDDQSHSLDAGRYRAAIAAIADAVPGMPVQITTESAGIFDVAQQMACLEALRPAAASISVSEMARDPDRAARIYALCRDADTRVQHILYSPDCLAQLDAWDQQGLIAPSQRDVILVLGRYSPARHGHPQELSSFLSAIRDRAAETASEAPAGDGADSDAAHWRWSWSVCAFGPQEPDCLLAALAAGGGARIGFENNMIASDGSLFADNAASVRAFVDRASAAGLWPDPIPTSAKDTLR